MLPLPSCSKPGATPIFSSLVFLSAAPARFAQQGKRVGQVGGVGKRVGLVKDRKEDVRVLTEKRSDKTKNGCGEESI